MSKLFITLILAAVVLISCNSSSTPNAQPLVVAADTAVVKYQCPMKCQKDTAYTTAGECPVCTMDLIKK